MAEAIDNYSSLNFNKICRICIESSEGLISIAEFKIVEMIKTCASVQIWVNDNLPNQICEFCFKKLESSFTLIMKCKDSDAYLRKLLDNLTRNNEESNDYYNTVDSLDWNEYKTEEANKEKNKHEIAEKITVKVEAIELNEQTDVNCVKVETEEVTCDDFEASVLKKRRKKIRNVCENAVKTDIKSNVIEPKKLTFHFSCEECNAKFYKAAHLGTHMHEVHKAIGTKCESCSILIYHPDHLKSHMKAHAVSQKFQCETCGKNCSKLSNLKRHRAVHETESRFMCLICSSAFKDKWTLNSHTARVHTGDTHKPCFICGKPIIKSHMHEHVRTHRADRPKYTCNICGLTVYTKMALKKHVKIKHEGESLEYNHLCNVCGKRADSAARLRVHQRMHTGERPYTCDRCNKTFVSLPALKRHVRVHLELRTFVCDICSRAFYTSSEVSRHRKVHSTERPHQCCVCDKTFRTMLSLKNHRLKVHAGDK